MFGRKKKIKDEIEMYRNNSLRLLNKIQEISDENKKIDRKFCEAVTLVKILISKLPEKKIEITDAELRAFTDYGYVLITIKPLEHARICQLVLPKNFQTNKGE